MDYLTQLSLLDPRGCQADVVVPTVDDFIETVFLPAKANLAPTTLDGYESYIRRYVSPWFGSTKLNEINFIQIQAMINSCPTYKVAKTARDTLSAVLGLASNDMHILSYNPAAGKFAYPDRIEPDEPVFGHVFSTFAEISEILELVREQEPGSQLERCLLGGLGFGLRPGETVGLDGPHMHIADRYIHINQSYTTSKHGSYLKSTKTTAGNRELPFLDQIYDRAKEIGPSGPDPDGPWVTNTLGKRARVPSVNKHLRAFIERNGLPRFTLASCRHSFATAALRSGMSVRSLQYWLGHSDPSVTLKHYCKVKADDLRRDAAGLSRVFSGSIPHFAGDGQAQWRIPEAKAYEELETKLRALLELLMKDPPDSASEFERCQGSFCSDHQDRGCRATTSRRRSKTERKVVEFVEKDCTVTIGVMGVIGQKVCPV